MAGRRAYLNTATAHLKTGQVSIKAPLTGRDLAFINQYVLDLNVEAASMRSGFGVDAAKTLLRSKEGRAAVQVLLSDRSRRNNIYADDVLRRWWTLATADARELIEVRRVNCRHCWGVDFDYQFTLNELRMARRRHVEAQRRLRVEDRVEFDERGGEGYNKNRVPNKDCPECSGDGVERVHVHDSRYYSPGAAILYNGAEVTKDGKLRILMRDRTDAEKMVGHHVGMFINRNVNMTLNPTELTDDQLDDAIEQFDRLISSERDIGGGSGPLLEHSPAREGEKEE